MPRVDDSGRLVEPGPSFGTLWQTIPRLEARVASLVSNDLQWFLDAMPDAVLIVGPDGQIRRANAKVETVFGYQPQELIGQPLEMLLPERLRAPHSVHRTVYRATAKTRGMGTGLEWRALRKDGTESPVGVSLSPASHDENGRLVIKGPTITNEDEPKSGRLALRGHKAAGKLRDQRRSRLFEPR